MTVELSIGKITATKETLEQLISIFAIYASDMAEDDCHVSAARAWGDFSKLMEATKSYVK